MLHEWIKSPLGHGEAMCKNCLITNREAAILDLLNGPCPKGKEKSEVKEDAKNEYLS